MPTLNIRGGGRVGNLTGSFQTPGNMPHMGVPTGAPGGVGGWKMDPAQFAKFAAGSPFMSPPGMGGYVMSGQQYDRMIFSSRVGRDEYYALKDTAKTLRDILSTERAGFRALGAGGGGMGGGGGYIPNVTGPMGPWGARPFRMARGITRGGGAFGGGGGAGGGGGGPGGLGGAFGGWESIPGLAWAGRILKAGGPLAMGAAGIWELMNASQNIAGLNQWAIGGGERYTNLVRRSYAAATAGGGTGAGFLANFYGSDRSAAGATAKAPPAWMAMLGVSPEDAMASLQRYGLPVSAGAAGRRAAHFAALSATTAFSGLEGAPEAIERQAGALNIGTANRSGVTWEKQLAGILEYATAHGMDKARVLQNIQMATEQTARMGAGVAGGDIARIFGRFASSGLPGGRTGEMAANVVAGLSQLSTNLSVGGGTAPQMMTAWFGAQKLGLSNPKNLQKLLGPEKWAELNSTAEGRDLIKRLPQAMAMGPVVGNQYLGELLKGSPEAQFKLQQAGMPTGMGPVLGPIAMRNLTGIPGLTETLAMQRGGGIPKSSGARAGAQAEFLTAMGRGGTWDPALKDQYPDMLRSMGVPEAFIGPIMKAAEDGKVDPIVMAATMKHESGFKNVTHKNANGTTDYGPAQINSDTLKRFGMTSEYVSTPEGAAMAMALHMRSNINAGVNPVAGYNPGNPDELAQVAGAIGIQVPTGINKLVAQNAQAGVAGAESQIENFGTAVSAFDAAVSKFGAWAERLSRGAGSDAGLQSGGSAAGALWKELFGSSGRTGMHGW